MNLQEFVTTSIEEIITGILRAQDTLDSKGVVCALNPVWKDQGLQDSNIRTMEFDIAVTVASVDTRDSSGKFKMGIQVLGAELSRDGQRRYEESSVSRVKFSFPYLPLSKPIDRSKQF